ncbi:hypothetical protein K432DRAFT_382140 [Lepidopterella palustris CBS 459.81]|uniref:Alpha/beta-hydrolase n=1 Tax=Lepidopterella palustris CBS 459.81 TaxID=1314670 RepID=A0A8E2EAP2_9PEZI|nr:hypothetical protein K432DRAFT_382140 [Lepidopterella palustris CBS 459.81]
MSVTFTPSQVGGPSAVPLPYTGPPGQLCVYDLKLIFKYRSRILGVILPWNKWLSGELDELYPSIPNLVCMGLHLFLFLWQSFFLISIPFCLILPLGWVIIYMAAVFLINAGVSRILNGPGDSLDSKADIGSDVKHEEERWIFLNGVAVGRHWLQCNIDRLALTFRRPVLGVHNRTNGFIFDLIQCMIERNFCYPTEDVRTSYVQIKSALLDDKYKKVVLILHSQGGIEGSLILDWLLDEVPQDLLQQLEIYTFGSAANHFNNPHRSYSSMQAAKASRHSAPEGKAIRYIEHYADSGDFVARWGVLSFNTLNNRYMGRVFTRPGSGHLLNQHYMNTMFPLGPDKRVLKTNDFMEMEANISNDAILDEPREGILSSLRSSGAGADEDVAIVEDINSPISLVTVAKSGSLFASDRVQHPPKVKDLSRLWLYRNGGSPPN